MDQIDNIQKLQDATSDFAGEMNVKTEQVQQLQTKLMNCQLLMSEIKPRSTKEQAKSLKGEVSSLRAEIESLKESLKLETCQFKDYLKQMQSEMAKVNQNLT